MKRKIRIFVMIVCFLTFVVSLTYVVKEVIINPYQNNEAVNEAKELLEDDGDETNVEKSDGGKRRNAKERLKKYAELAKQNSDVKGWIQIDDTKIDYPVLQSEKDDFEKSYYHYLHYDWKGNSTKLGSIALLKGIDILKDNVFVLIGHNIDYPPCMFHDILKYSDLNFYKEHAIVKFDTIYEKMDWVVFSVLKVQTGDKTFDILQSSFQDDKQYMEHIDTMRSRSLIKNDIPIDKDDKILVLYTCSYETNESRTVIVARKIRDDEKVNNYVENATD